MTLPIVLTIVACLGVSIGVIWFFTRYYPGDDKDKDEWPW